MDDSNQHRCECGQITGVYCPTSIDSPAATIEWVPPYQRRTAATLGSWRGLSERLAVAPECVPFMVDGDEWIEEIEEAKR